MTPTNCPHLDSDVRLTYQSGDANDKRCHSQPTLISDRLADSSLTKNCFPNPPSPELSVSHLPNARRVHDVAYCVYAYTNHDPALRFYLMDQIRFAYDAERPSETTCRAGSRTST